MEPSMEPPMEPPVETFVETLVENPTQESNMQFKNRRSIREKKVVVESVEVTAFSENFEEFLSNLQDKERYIVIKNHLRSDLYE